MKSYTKKPDWFNLDNYKKAIGFDPGFWAYQLSVRASMIQSLDIHQRLTDDQIILFTKIKEKGVDAFKWEFPDLSITEQGNLYPKQVIEAKYNDTVLAKLEHLSNQRGSKGLSTQSVSAVTVFDLINVYASLSSEAKQSNNLPLTDQYIDDLEEVINRSQDTHNIHSTRRSESLVLIEIDLNEIDSSLNADFNRVIKALRTETGINPKNKSLTVNNSRWTNKRLKLVNQKVLPFLDLFIHQRTESKEYSNEELDEILHEDELSDPKEDRVRRTIRNNALLAIRSNEIEALYSLYLQHSPGYWKSNSTKNL